MEMQEFDQRAWGSFSGSEAWHATSAEGALPLIGEGRFATGEHYCMVLDRTGGCLTVEGDPQNDFGGYVLDLPFPTQKAAQAFASGIGEPKSKQDFFAFGFQAI
ncbi:MAG: hypothetical protein JW963_11075 [Anaerolineales bacterium]|nr:hypothetical protein [Anaerolineales bacterium]